MSTHASPKLETHTHTHTRSFLLLAVCYRPTIMISEAALWTGRSWQYSMVSSCKIPDIYMTPEHLACRYFQFLVMYPLVSERASSKNTHSCFTSWWVHSTVQVCCPKSIFSLHLLVFSVTLLLELRTSGHCDCIYTQQNLFFPLTHSWSQVL